ncbi:MAG: DMT family transporter [Firmicutes bacterium]|nr:DMT family transporter [Bacillota bacterium]
MAVQGALNSGASRIVGLLETSLAVQVLGTLTAALALLAVHLGGLPLNGPEGSASLAAGQAAAGGRAGVGGVAGNLALWLRVPWWMWLGGPLAVAIVFCVAFGIRRSGVVQATTAIVTAQLLAAALIDHLGLLGAEKIPFAPLKLAGVALIAAGAYVLLD